MIKPVNSHIVIEPLKHDSFISSQKESYEEIGVIVDYDYKIKSGDFFYGNNGDKIFQYVILNIGDKVYFDSWLAAKYPKGNNGEYYWLVKWEDIRAIEHAENTIPE